MKKLMLLTVVLSVALALGSVAYAVEFEPASDDPAMNKYPEEMWIDPAAYSSKIYYDLPYCGENSTKTQKLHLLLPEEGEGPYPVLVSVHGGAWSSNNSKKDHTVTFTQAAAFPALERGYAVACVDYSIKSKNNPVVFPLAMQEVRAAVRYLRSVAGEYNLDTEKFALIGESAGGQLVDMAGLTSGEEYYDNADLGNMDQSGDVQAVIAQYSAPIMEANAMTARLFDVEVDALTQEMLDSCTAMAHIDANDPPFYIMAGSADTTIPYTNSVDFYDALVAAGVQNCELHIYDGMEHSVAWFQTEPVTTAYLDWLDGVFGR